MSEQTMKLPSHIPWCQIGVTEQMIDKGFGDRRFPAPWRSSMAISAYEPKTEDLPEEINDKRITYLKVTCTITGYQPTPDETDRGYADLDDGTTDFRMIFEEYLACYGVLLNVAVFPARLRESASLSVGDDNLNNYPRIIAMEPKNRDLYQVASKSAEILTASNSRVSTDKTLTQTEETEQGFEVEVPLVDDKGKKIGGIKSSKSRTDTDEESWSVQTDASLERRETQGTTTKLSQMYNLLTGYHQGTNRATFLMLPRPHTLQPTDRRTFIQGLRVIEGVTEFMLILERPSSINSLCIEAFLETGHFPENPDFTVPKQKFQETTVERKIKEIAISGRIRRNTIPINQIITINEIGTDGYELDLEKGISGVSEEILADDNAEGTTGSGNLLGYKKKQRLANYSYRIESPNKLIISGKLTSIVRGTTTFHRKYLIHLRKPITEPGESHTTVTDLLITQRGLEVCIKSGNGCPEVIKDIKPSFEGTDRNAPIAMFNESIVDERDIRMNPSVFTQEATRESQLPATKELLRQIQKTMMTSGRLPNRYPAGKVGFLESNYFKKRITNVLPRERLNAQLASVKDLPDKVINSFGGECTVAEALKLSLSKFAQKTGFSIEEAAKERRRLLGLKVERDNDTTINSEQSNTDGAE